MKGVRFYEEYTDATRTQSRGAVVAVLVANGQSPFGYDAIAGAYESPNSPVCSTGVAVEYLRTNCKRIPESRAREIHPNLFALLETS